MMGTKGGVADTKVATNQQPTNAKTKSAPRSNEATLKKLQGYVKEWLAYREKLTPSWERDTKLYHNQRYQKNYQGIADTFVPMARSTVETIYSVLGTADLSTEFVPQDIYEYLKDRLMTGYSGSVIKDGLQIEESESEYLVRAINEVVGSGIIKDESLEVINDLYRFYFDTGKWRKVVRKMIKSGLKIGNGAVYMTYEGGKPRLISVPFPDFVFDPNCTDDDNGRFKGRRYLASLSELKAETIVDADTGKTRKRFDLRGVTAKTLYDEQTDKQTKESLLFGSTSDIESNGDQVEVIELYYDTRKAVLINRAILAEEVENPIVTQAKLRGVPTDELLTFPCATWANYEDESLYIGESEISLMWKEQERLNDATNQKSDAVTRALLQLYRADPSLKPQSKSFSVPGATIWAQANQFDVMPQANVPLAAFTEENSIKNNIREVTATDQLTKGVGSTGDITATEAQLQVANSSERNNIKVDSLIDGPLDRIARLTLQYIRLFITDPYVFTPKETKGIRPTLYDPKKFNYVFEPKVTLTVSATAKRKQEQRESVEIYKVLIADPTNNLQEVKRVMLPKIADIDPDELDKIITPEATPEAPTADPMSDPMAEQMPPGMQGMPEAMPAMGAM